MRRRIAPLIVFATALGLGCSPPEPAPSSPSTALGDGHMHMGAVEYVVAGAETIRLSPGLDISQVGLRFDAVGPDAAVGIEVTPLRRGAPGVTRAVEVTWREARLGVARLILDAPADGLELRMAGIRGAVVGLYPEVRARLDGPLARTLPVEGARGVPKQARGPAGIITREQWGARSPGRLCSPIGEPYRMSIHHTASPSDDGPDAAQRLRQMQAYHIDSNGWCDIGYHFVVSQAGGLYEARRDERRAGAHVGGQNSGNVGISLIGNFEVQALMDGQFATVVEIVRWVSVTHGIALNRGSVKGHREWPGQSTSCPGANLLNALDRILATAAAGIVPEPDPEPAPEPEPQPEPEPPPGDPGDTALTIEWMDGVSDAPGTHPGWPDVPARETFRVGLRLYNGAGEALRDVRLGFAFDDGLVPVDYAIQTDHPARDGETWTLNDADAADENPPKDDMGQRGELVMYAFGAGETKRVVIELLAIEPALDPTAAVRAWVANAQGLHRQDDWRSGVADRWQAEARVAAQARDHWLFDAEREPEGWVPCVDGALVGWSRRVDGSLALSTGCVVSPPWTELDADAWPEVTLWMSAPPGEHLARLIWDGAGVESGGAVEWTFFGDGQVVAHVVALSGHPGWRGPVRRLRLHLDGAREGELYRIGAIYGQSPVDRTTSAVGQTVPRDPPVSWDEADPDTAPPRPPEGVVEPEPEPEPAMRPDAGLPLVDGGVAPQRVADEGCAAGPMPTDPCPLGWLMLLAPALWVGRRRLGRRPG